jgi:hypothetical protein
MLSTCVHQCAPFISVRHSWSYLLLSASLLKLSKDMVQHLPSHGCSDKPCGLVQQLPPQGCSEKPGRPASLLRLSKDMVQHLPSHGCSDKPCGLVQQLPPQGCSEKPGRPLLKRLSPLLVMVSWKLALVGSGSGAVPKGSRCRW